MTVTLENSLYKVEFSTKGAEIQSFVRKDDGSDIVWKGESSVWKNHAPILFPFIGRCVGGYYDIEGLHAEYSRNHGFARDVEHALKEQSSDRVVFELKADESTLLRYPYHFLLVTEYVLTEKGLNWKLKVENQDQKEFGFSIGTHTAFAGNISDCVVEFEKKTPLTGIRCTPEGFVAPFINGKPDTFTYGEKNPGIVNIPQDGFGNGHLVLNNGSEWISLTDTKTGKKSVIQTEGFKYIMLWQNTSGPAQFICIEPWHGLPDASNTDHIWLNKPELIFLKPGKTFECTQNLWAE